MMKTFYKVSNVTTKNITIRANPEQLGGAK